MRISNAQDDTHADETCVMKIFFTNHSALSRLVCFLIAPLRLDTSLKNSLVWLRQKLSKNIFINSSQKHILQIHCLHNSAHFTFLYLWTKKLGYRCSKKMTAVDDSEVSWIFNFNSMMCSFFYSSLSPNANYLFVWLHWGTRLQSHLWGVKEENTHKNIVKFTCCWNSFTVVVRQLGARTQSASEFTRKVANDAALAC